MPRVLDLLEEAARLLPEREDISQRLIAAYHASGLTGRAEAVRRSYQTNEVL